AGVHGEGHDRSHARRGGRDRSCRVVRGDGGRRGAAHGDVGSRGSPVRREPGDRAGGGERGACDALALVRVRRRELRVAAGGREGGAVVSAADRVLVVGGSVWIAGRWVEGVADLAAREGERDARATLNVEGLFPGDRIPRADRVTQLGALALARAVAG